MLKYKPVFDRQAQIVDYKMGVWASTRDFWGLLICKLPINHDVWLTKDPKHLFTLSGMDDDICKHYAKSHPLGTIITCLAFGIHDDVGNLVSEDAPTHTRRCN